MDGFLIVDKPPAHTSHDVVARVRKAFHQKRVGHAGTLDPDATGVLIVLLGHATRLAEYTADYPKHYVARMRLGIRTSTQDSTGVTLETADASAITRGMLEEVVAQFTGDILQVPPMVSAVHHKGQRLHDLARKGIIVDVPPRPVIIQSMTVTSFESGVVAHADLDVLCSSGTYVRTLCHDIGYRLGVGGCLQTLRRTAIGPFSVEEAVSITSLEESPLQFVRNSQDILPPDWPRFEGDDDAWNDIRHGCAIQVEIDSEYAAFLHAGRLGAVLQREGEAYRPNKVFMEPEP